MTEDGYSVVRSGVSTQLLDQIYAECKSLTAHRGIRSDGSFWHSAHSEPVDDLQVWWTTHLGEHVVSAIDQQLRPWVQLESPYSVYTVDCVWSAATNASVHPHVDTPYRFSQWQGDSRLLAQQFIVPLDAVDSWNGATGIVKGSHRYIWPIDCCYAGLYDQFFAANCEQPSMSVGDFLTYDPRVLHSTMPNYSGVARPVLLVSYLLDSLVSEVAAVDESKA